MDIQTALHEILASPATRDVALVAVPGLVTGLIMVFRQEHKLLKNQVREQLNLLTEQNKDVADLKSTLVELRAQQKVSTDRQVELKDQIDRLHEELEKTRDDFNINQLYSSIDNGPEDNSPSSTQFQPMPSLQSDGIAEMLQSLEPAEPAAPPAPAPVEQPPVFTSAQAEAIQAAATAAYADSLYQTAAQAVPPRPEAQEHAWQQAPAAPSIPAQPPAQPAARPVVQPASPPAAPAARASASPVQGRSTPATATAPGTSSPDMTQSFAAPVESTPSDTAFDLDQYL